MTGILYIVGTPIGNLEDITIRSIRILKSVNLIAAEDTRVTAKLLKHFEIETKAISYHRHSTEKREEELIKLLQNEQDIALVTDAGMPGISDPGYKLVQKAVENSIEVIPIPGVSSVVTALAASGLNADAFLFIGFLPSAKKDLIKTVDETVKFKQNFTVVAFEAPHRIKKTLQILSDIFPDLQIVIGRELTKKFEQFLRGSATELAESVQDLKGEIVIIWKTGEYITKNSHTENVNSDALLYAKNQVENGESIKTAAKTAAEKYNVSRKYLYQELLQLFRLN